MIHKRGRSYRGDHGRAGSGEERIAGAWGRWHRPCRSAQEAAACSGSGVLLSASAPCRRVGGFSRRTFFWGREICKLGHEVRHIPLAYVRRFVKRQKHAVADRSADDTTGMQVQDYSQVKPALTGPNVADITRPFLVWCFCHEVTIQQVRCDIQLMVIVPSRLMVSSALRPFVGDHSCLN